MWIFFLATVALQITWLSNDWLKWFFFSNYKLFQTISDLVAIDNSHEIWNNLNKFVIQKEKSFHYPLRPLCYKYISYIWVKRNPAGALAFNYRGFYPLCHISKPINKIRSAIWSAIDGYFMPSCILNLFSWNGKGKCFKMMDLTLFSLHTLMQYLQSQNIPVLGKLVRHTLLLF